jgi:hypothetical protein
MNVVDFLIAKQREAADLVLDAQPPYLWAGRDPVRGLDCGGLGLVFLGRGGYIGGDLNAQGFYENVYCGTKPDPKLGPRAADLYAVFLKNSEGAVTHVGFPYTRDLIIDATPPYVGILPKVFHGYGNDTDDAGLYFQVKEMIENILKSGTIPGKEQFAEQDKKISMSLTGDSFTGWDNGIGYLEEALTWWGVYQEPDNSVEHGLIENQMELFISDYSSGSPTQPLESEFDSLPEPIEDPTYPPYLAIADVSEIGTQIRRLLSSINPYPEGISIHAEDYEYERSRFLGKVGVDYIKWMQFARLLGVDGKDLPSAVNVISYDQFRNWYVGSLSSSGWEISKRYIQFKQFQNLFAFPQNLTPVPGYRGST